MKKIIASLLLLSSPVSADTLINYGVGVAHSAKYSAFETKYFSAGVTDQIYGPFRQKREIGLWADQIGEGRKSSGFASYSLGIACEPSIFFVESDWGVSVITNRDAYLGGNFPQFTQDLYAALQDSRKTRIGINYKHYSSAGLYKQNKGRDFATIRIEIGF